MYMGANFLTRLCRPEDSDNRNVGGIFGSRRFITLGQLRVEFGGSGLVMIDAVESDSEEIHGRSEKTKLKERAESDRMAANKESKSNEKVLREAGLWHILLCTFVSLLRS